MAIGRNGDTREELPQRKDTLQKSKWRTPGGSVCVCPLVLSLGPTPHSSLMVNTVRTHVYVPRASSPLRSFFVDGIGIGE